jgi:thioester reductase-like protein
MLPVDYLARAVLHLAQRGESAGRTYHLIHSQPVSSDLLFEACIAEGVPVRRVPYGEWHGALMDIARGDPAHPLYPLVALFAPREEDDDMPMIRELLFDCRNSHAALSDAPFEEPALDLPLFRTYLRAFLQTGTITKQPAGDQTQ